MSRIKETRHLWYIKNRDRIIEDQKAYRKAKMNNDYHFRSSVVNYQAKYYQKRKLKIKQTIINIKPLEKNTINIDVNDTIVIF